MNDEQIERLADALLSDWSRFEDEAQRCALVEQDGEAGEERMRELVVGLLRLHLRSDVKVIEDDGEVEEWDEADLPRW